MTHRVQPPDTTQQEVAPARREVVGQVRDSRRKCQESAKGSGWVDVGVFSLQFSSSASPRSSGTHTGKPPELCTSERPEGEESNTAVSC